ncbi:unnamed protein product, partial [Meganyctiphanes norvegica]
AFWSQTTSYMSVYQVSSLLVGLMVVSVQGRMVVLASPNGASDGCGPNPITLLVTAASDMGTMSSRELMSLLESDRATWGEFLSLIHAYDDCVRTGDGIRYKRKDPHQERKAFNGLQTAPLLRGLHNYIHEVVATLGQNSQDMPH